MTLRESSAVPIDAGRRQSRIVFVEHFYYPEGWGGAEARRKIMTHLDRRCYSDEVICGSELYAPLDGDPGPNPAAAGARLWRSPRLLGGDIDRFKMPRKLGYCAGLLPRLSLSAAADVYVAQSTRALTCRSSGWPPACDVDR